VGPFRQIAPATNAGAAVEELRPKKENSPSNRNDPCGYSLKARTFLYNLGGRI
jgi:hypothetical protein